MGLLLASSTLVGVAAGLTAARGLETTSGTGYVEICKVLTAAPAGVNINMNASFTYTITGVSGTTSVAAGTCSPEIAVPVNATGTTPITITETQAPWFKVASITELAGQSYMGTPNLTTGSVVVSVGNNTNVDTVTYTNNPVTGYVEVCKVATSGSGLTGTFGFTVTGADGFSNATTAAAVGVNNCSDPIIVPAGTVTVTEGGTNLYVTGITATTNGLTSTNDITNPSSTNPNLTTGTVTVNVAASADSSNQTDVTYTNNVVAFKLCKTWGSGTEPGGSSTSFPFTMSATGPVGPNTVPATASLLAGQCTNPVSLRPGTAVTVTEGIVPGTKVQSISATGAESLGTPSLTTRSVTIIVGTPTTSSTAPTNEAILTFQNQAADPGTLKICKAAGAVPPVGNVFSFTVSGVSGTTSVNLGSCAFVGGSVSPTLFPYNSTVTVTEAASADNATSAISTSPTYVNLNGTPNTSETVLSGTPNLGGTNTTSSVSVVIGEDTLTEVTFTDVDPPATVTDPGAPAPVTAPVTVSIPGGSNLGVTTGPGLGVATLVSTSPAVTTAAATVAVANTATASSGHTLTAAQKKALLKQDKALLKSVDAKIAAEQRTVAHTKGAAHRAALKALASLKARQHVLNVEISIL